MIDSLCRQTTYQTALWLKSGQADGHQHAGGEGKGQNLAMLFDNQTEFESAHRTLTARCTASKYSITTNAPIMVDLESIKEKADTMSTTAQQIGPQHQHDTRDQAHKAAVTDQTGELGLQMAMHVVGVVGFEMPIACLM